MEEAESLSVHTHTDVIKKKPRKPLPWHSKRYKKIINLLGRNREPEKLPPSQQIIGEIGFQLDQRILSAVIQEARLYGHCMANIQDKIMQHSTCKLSGQVNDELRATLNQRYKNLMERLRTLGYDPAVHVPFTEDLVNSNGIVKELPGIGTNEHALLTDVEYLRGTWWHPFISS